MFSFLVAAFVVLGPSTLVAAPKSHALKGLFDDPVHVELIQPHYNPPNMWTAEGGVIWSPRFRLQARSIKQLQDHDSMVLEAKGDLLLIYRDRLWQAGRFVYDVSQRQATLTQGAMALGPGYLLSGEATIKADGTLLLNDCLFTADPSTVETLALRIGRAKLQGRVMTLQRIKLYCMGFPLLYLPSWRSLPDRAWERPLTYSILLQGRSPFLGIRAQVYGDETLQAWTGIYYHLRKGWGLGLDIEGTLFSGDLQTRHFMIHDTSIVNPQLRRRYRIKGTYKRPLDHGFLLAYYDKFSDADMPDDFSWGEFGKSDDRATGILWSHYPRWGVQQFQLNLRANSFETVKCKLPSYTITLNPSLAGGKWIVDLHNRVEFLEYAPSEHFFQSNYSALRVVSRTKVSHPYTLGSFNFTPTLGYYLLGYSSMDETPERHKSSGVCMPVGQLNIQGPTWSWRSEQGAVHLLSTYCQGEWIHGKRDSFNERLVFDGYDAVIPKKECRVGVSGVAGTLASPAQPFRYSWSVDWIGALDKQGQQQPLHRLLIDGKWLITPRWKIHSTSDWQRQGASQLTFRSEHTLSRAVAALFEYAYQGKTHWRKSQRDNYDLERMRDVDDLIAYRMSLPHQRVTTRWHCHVTPALKVRLDGRYGWGLPVDDGAQEIHRSTYHQWGLSLAYQLLPGWQLKVRLNHMPSGWGSVKLTLGLSDTLLTVPESTF